MRVAHVGLGPLGRAMVRELARRPELELVGAADTDPRLAGRPLGELVPELAGRARELRVVPDAAELDGPLDAALVTTVSDLALCAPTLRALLARGAAVVSTCEELVWPWLRHAELADELHGLARAGGGRLLGTGVNPGFLMDALPVFASAVCLRVDAVEVWRIQDAAPRRVPFQAKIGATLELSAFEERRRSGSLRHVGLLESLCFVAHALGLPLDEQEETLEPVVAERELACDLGIVRPGCAAGVRQVAEGRARLPGGGTRTVARLVFQAAVGQADPHDRVRIAGEPELDLRFAGGVHGDLATVAIALNALPALAEAAPGLHTMATIRPPHAVGAGSARRG